LGNPQADEIKHGFLGLDLLEFFPVVEKSDIFNPVARGVVEQARE